MAAQYLTEPKANTGPHAISRGSPPVRLRGNGPHSAVLQLQRLFGNERVARMIRGGNITAAGRISGIQCTIPAPAAAEEQHEQKNSSAGILRMVDADAPLGTPGQPYGPQPLPMESHSAENQAPRDRLPQPSLRIARTPSGQKTAGHGLTFTGVQAAKRIQRKDTCSDSSSDEARWAGQNEGKVFKSGDNPKEPTEAILWNFCVGESKLREQHRLSLKQDAARWKGLLAGTGKTPATRSDLRIKIKGTASASGNKAGNEKIALDRAQALKSFLESEGIPGSFIIIEGLGSTLPLADETSPENMARNRRVELFFFKPTVTADITGALVAANVNKISIGKPSGGVPAPSFRKSANMFSRVHFAMTASADVDLTGFAGDSIGFYQLLTGDQRIGLYTSEKDGSELLLDYGRCNTVLPCRDVLDATSSFSIDDRSLVLTSTGSASGTVRISDRPGTGFPMRYPDPAQGPFVLSRYFWKMDFDLILGVRSASLFMPLQAAAWSLAAAENVDVAKQTTVGMAPISVHQPFVPVSAAGKKDEMDKAFANQTCRLMARSREVAPEELPCRPVEI
jgi:outer membrane protein OmpA-like peptidoglycan-associated protein